MGLSASEVKEIARQAGMHVEVDTETNQLVIYTGIPEGAPEVTQGIAWEWGWEEDVTDQGEIILLTRVVDQRS